MLGLHQYKILKLKSKVQIILLPIALALILPVIGFYSNGEVVLQNEKGFFVRWFSSFFTLYTFWHLLWYFSSDKFRNYRRWIWLIPFVFFGVLYGVLDIIGCNVRFRTIVRLTFASVIVLIVQYAIRTQQKITQLLLEKEQIQTENYKAQLKALHAKIDPHFLFNSMNTLRSMVRQGHANSEKFILSLSDFYRQTLKYKDNTTIELSEELAVLESYLFLMKNRNEAAVSIQQNVESSLHQYRLPTLALQVVVENCFKHNSMASKMPLHIKIENAEGHYIQVSNNIQPKFGKKEASGYGLDLLRKRYELLNIEQGVIIEETPHQFMVKLKLIGK